MALLEWLGVGLSLTGSVLNARGMRISFLIWSVSALLLGAVALHLKRYGWFSLQVMGAAINMYGSFNWKENAITRSSPL